MGLDPVSEHSVIAERDVHDRGQIVLHTPYIITS